MNWSRRHTLIAGLALVAVTNGVALGGAAWNRSGTPDSVLALTQRELEPPYMFKGAQENSGLTLPQFASTRTGRNSVSDPKILKMAAKPGKRD